MTACAIIRTSSTDDLLSQTGEHFAAVAASVHSHENCGCPILRVRAPARILAWMVRTPHNLLTRCALMPPYLLYIDDIAMSSPFWPFYSLCSSSAFGVEQSADVHLFERTSMDARFRAHQAGNEKERRNIWVGVSRVRR
ncbi:hypothetical protein SEA_HEXBUG_64 [Gordonia phage Hexbug]|nr:hypothetical protein SEA_HEXBUG_64 [Gordonia phage Hexbug]